MHAKSVRIAGFLQNFRRLAVCGAARALAADESRDIQRAIAKEANCEGGAQCRANMMRNVILLISKALFVLIIIIAASIAPRPAHADNARSSIVHSVFEFIICSDWRLNPLVPARLYVADQRRKEENKVGISSMYTHMRGGMCYSGAKKQREWLEFLSENYGWPEATYALAVTYGYGDFDPPVFDFINYQGRYALAVREDLGDGEGLDLEAAFSLLKKAAEEGMPVAQAHLAQAYQTGEFGKDGSYKIERDPEQSLAWLEKLISDKENLIKWEFNGGNMDTRVMFELGYRYRYGEKFDIAPDSEKAFNLFAALAQDKSHFLPEATAELLLMCEHAIIVSEICSEDLYGQIQAELENASEEYREVLRQIYQGKIPHEEGGIKG